jgi:hypothetical protein
VKAESVHSHRPDRATRLVRLGWLLAFILLVVLQAAGVPATFQNYLARPTFNMGSDPLQVAAALQGAGISRETFAAYKVGVQMLGTIPLLVFGLLIFWRRSGDRAALLISFLLLISSYGPLATAVLNRLGEYGIFINRLLNVITPVSLPLVFYLFPDGRFVPRWTRWAALAFALILLPSLLFPGSRFDTLFSTPGPLAMIFILPFYGSLIYAQVYRYRKVSGPTERLQTKWVMLGMLLMPFAWTLNGLVIPTLAPELAHVTAATIRTRLWIELLVFQPLYLVFPIGMGISLMRYRLYDIDLIIRRTLVYSLLTIALGLIYLGVVVFLQNLLGGLTGERQPEIVIVISTLAIAALFTPLRRRIQGFIDRRFYRKKYSAEQALATFAAMARQETDLDELRRQVVEVVDQTVQPEMVRLWLRPTPPPARRLEG